MIERLLRISKRLFVQLPIPSSENTWFQVNLLFQGALIQLVILQYTMARPCIRNPYVFIWKSFWPHPDPPPVNPLLVRSNSFGGSGAKTKCR